MIVKWNQVLTDHYNLDIVNRFARNEISGEKLQAYFAGTEVSGQIRTLVRERGAQLARRITRKALRRRNLMS